MNVVYEKIKKAVKNTDVEHVIVSSPSDSLPTFKKMAYKISHRDTAKYDNNVTLWEDFMKNIDEIPEVKPESYNPEHAILIVHTGGTTGKPKGVMLGDKAINALAMQVAFNRVERGERFLNIMPPFIAYGYCYGVHAPLSKGGEVIIIPQFEPGDFGKLLNKYKPQHTAGVPLHYQSLVTDTNVMKADLSYLITTGAGGDAISNQAEDSVNEFLKSHNSKYALCKGYGMTEVSAGATACLKDINKRGSVGIPLFLTTIGIFKPDSDEELDFGCEGEICISTPTMMLGYYNMPEETKKVIRKHADGKLWVHTGDVGMMDEDGFIFIINRIKRMIIRHDGFKVFPSVIEEVVTSVEGAEVACAVAMKDAEHIQGDLPFVFVKLASDFIGDIKELEKSIRHICSVELPEYVQPIGYNFIDKIPYTGIGKVDYLSLQKRARLIKFEQCK